ncbi:hypothetical protein [Nitrosomonas aestuarii]|nr:hypothetical protein [Nitrosomonas aestuarii]PTN10938.1 hypothetical protein C8R11_11647 [Nitrosomonas aestuarii]
MTREIKNRVALNAGFLKILIALNAVSVKKIHPAAINCGGMDNRGGGAND